MSRLSTPMPVPKEAPVLLVRAGSGKVIPFGRNAASAAARGDALLEAVSEAQEGDALLLGPGDFDIGDGKIDLPHGVSLVGEGMHSTTILGNRLAAEGGAVISPGNNSYITNFTLDGMDRAGIMPIGARRSSGVTDKSHTGVVVRGVRVFSFKDGVHYVTTGGTSGLQVGIKIIDCEFYGGWHHVAVSAVTGSPQIAIDIFNCRMLTDGTLTDEENGGCMGVSTTSGTALVRMFGGHAICSGGSVANPCILTNGGGATVELYDVLVSSAGTAAVDLQQQTTSTLRVSGGKGSGTGGGYTTSGTITRASAGRVLADLLTVDGSGSGLDADMLRGTTPTAAGLALIDDADAAAQRTTLGVREILVIDGSTHTVLGDLATYYLGRSGSTPVTTAALHRFYIPFACTLKAAGLKHHITGTLGSTEDVETYVRINDTTDHVISTTIKLNASGFTKNSALNVSLAQGDFVELKIAIPNMATNPTNVLWALYLEVERT